MNNRSIGRRVLSFLLFVLVYSFNSLASSNGEFVPFSSFDNENRTKIINHYNIGTKIDYRITKMPFFKDLNILYTHHESTGNIVVTSGLYPINIPEVLVDDSGKNPIKVLGLCLARILLIDDPNFTTLLDYFQTMNKYENVRRDLLPTVQKTVGALEAKTVETSREHFECLKKLYDNFSAYKNVFVTYMEALKQYVQYICHIRKKEDSHTIEVINVFKGKIETLKQEDITKVKTMFDDSLVGAVREYAHSETAFLFYCQNVLKQTLPGILFSTRDMCHVCEDTLVKTGCPIVVVSTIEHNESWNRHTAKSTVKKVVIDTDVKFNSTFSSLTDLSKIKEIISEYHKLHSPRGISLLFQAPEIYSPFVPLFVISEEQFDLACGNQEKKIRRNQMAAYSMDAKLSTLSMLVRMYQCVFSKTFMGIKADTIRETQAMLASPAFAHMNQSLLSAYMDYMIKSLQPK